MSNTKNGRQHKREDSQLTALEQLPSWQREIEAQSQRVAMALTPIAEVLSTKRNVSREMMIHAKTQILKAHLQLDDLKQLLDSME
ncbi:MAG: hypothetical protein AUF64_00495 [Chloroflexi bacterium 13_1_20CM_54_36]|nr:MAG: hypothetical protein AUF64_00495 [Chloroflexi bacterium 13_1_20CM_54_36]